MLMIRRLVACLLVLSGCATQTEYTGNFVRLNQPERIIQHDFNTPYATLSVETKPIVIQKQPIIGKRSVEEAPRFKKPRNTSTAWAVQVVALNRAKTRDLNRIANHAKTIGFRTYIVEVNKLGKVRLGTFPLLEDARLVLNIARKNGYPDAFLVKENPVAE